MVMGIQPQTSSFFWLKRFTARPILTNSNAISATVTAFAFALTLMTLAGCQANLGASAKPTEASGDRASDTSASKSRDALPSMSAYTMAQTKGNQANEPSAASPPAGSLLAPGQYCFHKAGEKNWLSVRLDVDGDQHLRGESVGTVNHPTQGEVRYEQAFTGQLSGSQALVEVTTHIAGVSESRQESWKIDTAQLDMERVAIEEAPCVEVAANF